jgi:hypothetical protein
MWVVCQRWVAFRGSGAHAGGETRQDEALDSGLTAGLLVPPVLRCAGGAGVRQC